MQGLSWAVDNSKHLHCQDSLSSVAILTKRSKSTSRLLRRWDDIGLGFSALGRMHNTRSTLRWLMNIHQFRYLMQPSRSDPSRPRFWRRSIMKENIAVSQVITIMLVQLIGIFVGLLPTRGMPLQAKRLISVGAKCIWLVQFCQAVVYNLDRWIV